MFWWKCAPVASFHILQQHQYEHYLQYIMLTMRRALVLSILQHLQAIMQDPCYSSVRARLIKKNQ
jgi:hypothetical protein